MQSGIKSWHHWWRKDCIHFWIPTNYLDKKKEIWFWPKQDGEVYHSLIKVALESYRLFCLYLLSILYLQQHIQRSIDIGLYYFQDNKENTSEQGSVAGRSMLTSFVQYLLHADAHAENAWVEQIRNHLGSKGILVSIFMASVCGRCGNNFQQRQEHPAACLIFSRPGASGQEQTPSPIKYRSAAANFIYDIFGGVAGAAKNSSRRWLELYYALKPLILVSELNLWFLVSDHPYLFDRWWHHLTFWHMP